MNAKLVLRALAIVTVLAPPCAATAAAYHTYVERNAASGVPTHIWTFANCIGRVQYPFSGTAFAEHGTVAFKEAVKSRCGNPNAVTREVWYTSNAGFTGVDKVTFPRRRGHAEIFAIAVH
ncbi:hypothetical protein [Methylocapsa sp. S129]|uniref:hypothetical protein n=1 Tax=Methylocapsa sp. S129 TaxID=1641869 RepID=UPI00131DEBED|nr:hypothetical protein [Methylocapsa sp. S129]